MTAARTRSLIAQTLIAAAVSILVIGAVQALTASASAPAYSAPAYGSVMLAMSEEF